MGVSLAVASVAFPAFAQGEGGAAAAAAAESRGRYREGVQLTHQRKYELARAKFLEAIALDGEDAEAVLSLSVVETDLGHPVAAYVALRKYLKHPKADGATAAKARTRMVPALEGKVGQIAVTAPPGAEVTVDGVSVGRAPLEETAVVVPGAHVVAVAGVNGSSQSVEVGAGAKVSVSLVAAVEPVAPPVVPVESSALPPPGGNAALDADDKAPSSAKLVVPLVIGGAGAVAAGAGIGFFAAAGSKNSDAASSSAGRNCTGSKDASCVQALSLATTARNDKNVGTGLVIGGSAAAAGAIVTWLLWRSSQRHASARVVPSVGPGAASMTLVGSF